ncbi:HD domain-containing protein [Clostridium uliginosum]|uniref:5'-deoxynucleotidase n=1 Tax=Clostridium uliginosum TaxID=119641 RepID=A0A1I1R1R2_9CLOT|nr:HD domain-containing protein [Clostridium uliginosum]SFD25473.1 putative hydrolases of HD superfamily [Clostridium uliginosum]
MYEISNQIVGLIKFFKETELIKIQLRNAWLSNEKQESVAEHSWRMGMIALCLLNFEIEVDVAKILKMCIIHDLGEAYEGDIPAITKEDKNVKMQRETHCMNKLLGELEDSLKDELLQLWNEYNDGISKESKFVHGIDKIETLIQHIQGSNPANFDYNFNLEYGKVWTSQNEIFDMIRKVLDLETKSKISFNK